MTKILAINHNYLCDPKLDHVLNNVDQRDRQMLNYFCNMSHDMGSIQLGLMSRVGTDLFPFRNDILPMVDCCMPAYDPKFDASWEQISDRRAKEVESLVDQGKQLVVFWSGGIDSTCILVAILKNFNKHNLHRVTVACTWDGVAENPVFFHNHVVPNFTVVDTNKFVNQQLKQDTNTVIVEGFAADTLTMSMTPSLDVCMAVRNADLLSKSWKQPDQLLDYLERITGSAEFARWYYEKNRQSIESVDVPVETYFDFMWWIGFNCEYYSWALHAWFFCYRHLHIPYHQFKSRCVGWYRTDSYQQWAMNNNGPGVKHGNHLGSFKQHPKKYIFDYDKNEFYWRYKTKVNSPGRTYNQQCDQPFAITDQFDILYLTKNLDQILELIPTHIRT